MTFKTFQEAVEYANGGEIWDTHCYPDRYFVGDASEQPDSEDWTLC